MYIWDHPAYHPEMCERDSSCRSWLIVGLSGFERGQCDRCAWFIYTDQIAQLPHTHNRFTSHHITWRKRKQASRASISEK